MLKQVMNQEKDIVLTHMFKNRFLNFYLYMDLFSCGCENEGLGLWIKEDAGLIRFIIYRYNDCVHLYGNKKEIDAEVISGIRALAPDVISGSADIIEEVLKQLPESWIHEHNHIITTTKKMEYQLGDEMEITQAQKDDIPEIARIMMKSDIYSKVSTYGSLCKSLTKRNEQGFGRVFVLCDQGEIVASNATYAETDDMAVIGGLITDPQKRGKGYGLIITAYTWNLVKEEGKTGLAHIGVENTNSVKLHEKMGYDFIGKNARLLRR